MVHPIGEVEVFHTVQIYLPYYDISQKRLNSIKLFKNNRIELSGYIIYRYGYHYNLNKLSNVIPFILFVNKAGFTANILFLL